MKIAITGATGQLGRLVIAQLKTKVADENLVALVRSASKAADLGVEAREANYDDQTTLETALKGIDTVLLISGSEIGKRVQQHQNIIDAAKKNGVQRIVYTSLLKADTSTISFAEEHRLTEAALKASGITYTILRNGWYTENYAGSIPGAVAGGGFIGSVGEAKIASAGRIDFAEAAAAVLATEGHEGKVYELSGAPAWTLTDLAAEISKQSGKDIPYVNLSEADYAAALVGFGLPEELSKSIASWDVAASKGDLFDENDALSELIGRPTTPLATIVADTLKGI
jgi:NAD(P)H dehydrogenase (quinone)